MSDELEEVFTVQEVADRLKLNPSTIRLWIRNGKIQASNLGTTKSPEYRIKRSVLIKLLKDLEDQDK